MKKIQQEGIQLMAHHRKPDVYSGTWMENIQNTQELYNSSCEMTGPDAILRAFNLLVPFQGEFPEYN